MSEYNTLLEQSAQSLVKEGKGILAADESTGTANKRFAARGIPEEEDYRRRFRQLLITTEGIEEGLSGIILYDETIRQKTDDEVLLRDVIKEKGMMPGIKVDKGTVDLPFFPGEKITEGLDGLRERLEEYKDMGAYFTKWRSVIRIDESLPTYECIAANAYGCARYAALSQEAGLVPIVEPEVLLKGNHSMERCAEVTKQTLADVFRALVSYRVHLPGMLLKTNMVLPGADSGERVTSEEVAHATLHVLKETVPEEVSGVVFLSGGQSPAQATENLNAIAHAGGPWPLTFSYSRALQQPVMDIWDGKEENKKKAQEMFASRVYATATASQGVYDRSTEHNVIPE